ncbi:PREDICTED: L antigen family member 3 [Odobenus rosmarus divergens]|uniref:L antigen family member 3 n=1 Tax=Odobenus rosmarus divergens TaxID=9708 RepID=A0A9B0M3I6_ODORO
MLAAGADAGAGGGAGGADHGRDGLACHGGRGCPRLPGGAGTVAAAAFCRARPVSRPCALCVPFPSSLEAEIAYRSLTPDAEPHRGAVEKQLTVSCSVVAGRWRGEDPRLLRISIISFLDQLSLVMQTMRRFGPPVSR